MTTSEILKFPDVAIVLFITGYVMSLGLAFTAGERDFQPSLDLSFQNLLFTQDSKLTLITVVPVYLFTDVSLGGLGFSPLYISITMAVAGASQALWILFAFPPLHRRFGNGAVLRGCAIAWPIMFALHPLCNTLLRHDMKLLFWILFPPLMAIGSGVSMAFSKSSF